MIVKHRKIGNAIKICVDASDIFLSDKGSSIETLYEELSGIFKEAYCEGCLMTNDYLALCEIVIKKQPTLSTKQYCDLIMTADRVVMRLSRDAHKYENKICECFRRFYKK